MKQGLLALLLCLACPGIARADDIDDAAADPDPTKAKARLTALLEASQKAGAQERTLRAHAALGRLLLDQGDTRGALTHLDAVMQARANKGLKFIKLADDTMTKALGKYKNYNRVVVPKDVYRTPADGIVLGVGFNFGIVLCFFLHIFVRIGRHEKESVTGDAADFFVFFLLPAALPEDFCFLGPL